MPNMVGHNSGDLSESEYRALFTHWYREIAAQNAIVKAQQAAEKTLRKRAKADGIILRDIDFGLRCAQVDDPMIVADELRRHHMIAKFFNLPVGSQAGFDFEDETSVEKAGREGLQAGYEGRTADPAPYATGSPEGQEWLAKWHVAQQSMRDDLQSAMQKRNAARNKGNGDASAAAPDDAEYEEDEDQHAAAEG